jgi:hypothetical protein
VLKFDISIDGLPTYWPVDSNGNEMGVIYGDPDSYFLTTLAQIVVYEGGFDYAAEAP